ncbi:NAD(P)-dependent oxidoreductase [Specibacter cremeus]|uniref:NAD(P)-dependent oxidoreductase n=1 Tax=Specibacter cremeus TaxID=1629051 RepID=UPI000F78C4F2|nr:NAD(P)-dependent oxidoreductase [Specibacter cremeus]
MNNQPASGYPVLAAGDHFILPGIFRTELEHRMGGAVAVSELEFDWPDAPFGDVAEVSEASGTEDRLIEALRGQKAVVTQLAPLTRRVLEANPQLEIIGVSRGGPTNVNIAAAEELGIKVVNVPGRNGIATAEMTVGLMLALSRRIPESHTALAERRWRGEFYRHAEVGPEINGSTIGLIGAGAVGGHVARVLHAMGATVLVFDPYAKPVSLDGVATLVDDVDDVFARSTIVSVHARLTEETRHIVDAERLALMAPGGHLVNAARGPLVDYDAVVAALESGHLAGAAFDVFPTEPVDFDHPLFTLLDKGYNIVMTPHIAGASKQVAVRAAAGVAEEVRRHLAGEAPLHELTAIGATAARA